METELGLFEFNATDGYKSHVFWEPNNRLRQEGFHVVNALLTWKPLDSGFSLQVHGRNLIGYYYYNGGGDGAGGNDYGIRGTRKSAVLGKMVSVRVVLGGQRSITNK